MASLQCQSLLVVPDTRAERNHSVVHLILPPLNTLSDISFSAAPFLPCAAQKQMPKFFNAAYLNTQLLTSVFHYVNCELSSVQVQIKLTGAAATAAPFALIFPTLLIFSLTCLRSLRRL